MEDCNGKVKILITCNFFQLRICKCLSENSKFLLDAGSLSHEATASLAVCILYCAAILIGRAHSFPRKILPNSAFQFAKSRSSPRQNHPNSAAYHGLLFVSKHELYLVQKL